MAAVKRFYDDHVLPHLVNAAMSTKAMKEERQRCLEHVKGTVLEVGFGTGHNLPHYPRTVTKVVGIDPSETSARLARKRIAASPFPIEIIGLSAEKIPVPDASFESIVSTFTLCSIPDVAGALREMRRALHPDGRFYFVEHGRADDPRVERWQERLNGLEQAVFGGCHLNRVSRSSLRKRAFRSSGSTTTISRARRSLPASSIEVSRSDLPRLRFNHPRSGRNPYGAE